MTGGLSLQGRLPYMAGGLSLQGRLPYMAGGLSLPVAEVVCCAQLIPFVGGGARPALPIISIIAE